MILLLRYSISIFPPKYATLSLAVMLVMLKTMLEQPSRNVIVRPADVEFVPLFQYKCLDHDHAGDMMIGL